MGLTAASRHKFCEAETKLACARCLLGSTVVADVLQVGQLVRRGGATIDGRTGGTSGYRVDQFVDFGRRVRHSIAPVILTGGERK